MGKKYQAEGSANNIISADLDATSKRTAAVLELLKCYPDIDNSFALHEDGNTFSIHVFHFDSKTGEVCELQGPDFYKRFSEADFLEEYECRYWKVFGGRRLKSVIS